jgi:hypothetical protein
MMPPAITEKHIAILRSLCLVSYEQSRPFRVSVVCVYINKKLTDEYSFHVYNSEAARITK